MRCTLLFLFVIASLPACKKTDENPLIQPTRKDLLIRSQWREVGHTLGQFRNTPKSFTGGDVYDSQPACRHDDFLRFNADGTFVSDEGASRCAITDPQQKNDVWSLPGNTGGTQLVAALPHAWPGQPVGQPVP